MYQRTEIKREVKGKISATRPRPMWAALLYLIIASAGISLLQSLISALTGASFLSEEFLNLLMSGYEPEEVIGQMILLYANQLGALISTLVAAAMLTSIITTLWQGLMDLGFNGYCLSVIRGENPKVSRIFCGFPMFGKAVLTRFLVWVFTMLWSLLYAVCLAVVVVIAVLLMEVVPAVGVILIAAGCVGYVVLEVRLTLRYSMTNYVMLDTGKYGLEAITESKYMMKGNKGKLFMLQLSFIGWYLIEYAIILVGYIIIGVVAGVGVAAGGTSMGALAGMMGGIVLVMGVMLVAVWLVNIWLQPYVTGSVARFYLFFKPQIPEETESWPNLGDSTTTTYSGSSGTEY